jgi:ABC-2 type transport system permease protein
MLSIAGAEFRMLLRNRLVALLGIVTPVVFGAALLVFPPSVGDGSVTAVLLVVIMGAMGVYLTGTTTLAARRQTLFLKRLRSGSLADWRILGGLILPLVLINTAQIAAVLVVLTSRSAPPEQPWLLVLAVVTGQLMFTGFTFATAGVTNSPEHAQVTTAPLFFAALGAAIWVASTGTQELVWLKRALPGGAIGELVAASWNGTDLDGLIGMLWPSLAWAAAAAVAGRLLLRWEPRV